MNKGNYDQKLKIGLDSSDLEKDYKKLFAKLSRSQDSLNKLHRMESKLLKSNLGTRQSTVSMMERQLRLQQRINAAQGFVPKPTAQPKQQPTRPKSNIPPDSRISYQARTSLSERVKAASSAQYSGITDRGAAERIRATQEAMRRLNKEINSTKSFRRLAQLRIEFAGLQNEIRGAVRQQTDFNRKLSRANVIGAKFSSTLKGAALQFASAYAVIGAGREIFRVGKEFDSMQAGLLAASDSAEAAQGNFKFLMDTAKRLGTDVEAGVRGFNRLGVSMRASGFSAEEIKHVFSAASEASATFQLDAQRSNLVMLALSQISSKAKVSSEELKRLTPYTVMCM